MAYNKENKTYHLIRQEVKCFDHLSEAKAYIEQLQKDRFCEYVKGKPAQGGITYDD